MNQLKLHRRQFLTGIGVGTAAVTLTGCSSKEVSVDGENKPHYMMMFDQTKCVGCGRCTEACTKANNLPEGMSRLALERQTDRIEGEVCEICGKTECHCDRKYVRVSCQQCKKAPCVMVCPTGAAYRDAKTGIVSMIADKCAGCKYCIAACPYNARQINPDTDVADNCDFCLNSKLAQGELPACVQACNYGALVFGDGNDPKSYISRLLAVKNTQRIRVGLGTQPSLHYAIKMKSEI